MIILRLIVGDEDITSDEYDPASFFQQGLFSNLILSTSALDSAVKIPQHEYYKGIFVKAAALYRSLNLDHPFFDGNKRAATISLMIFLAENGYQLDASMKMEEIIEYTLEIAKGDHRDLDQIADWIEQHCHIEPDDKERTGGLVKAVRRLWDLYIR